MVREAIAEGRIEARGQAHDTMGPAGEPPSEAAVRQTERIADAVDPPAAAPRPGGAQGTGPALPAVPPAIQATLDRIARGESFPHRNDGSVFQNREGRLPNRPGGYYKEYVHSTPGAKGPGAQRVVVGGGGEVYYTPDHYQTFVQLK
jgi:guanyl-specific ribonuclease Sa